MEKTCDVSISGAGAIGPAGEAIVLTSGSPSDENSLDQPERVAPRSVALRDLGGSFTYRCPPHSLSVIKVKTRRE